MRRLISCWTMTCGIAVITSGARAEGDNVACRDCHKPEAAQVAQSIHHALACQDCHGGPNSYELSAVELERASKQNRAPGTSFDHGDAFLGRPSRLEIPERCGNCHADVERMNPYGLRTDQLARYRTSGHGKTLFEDNDDKVAVCTDCHGAPHDVLHADDPDSKTHPLNVPGTCGACHADAQRMAAYDLPTEVVDEYRQSVHGVLLFDQRDTGAPTCATCHGNHSAMPPGFASVGAVCGRCHEHDATYFATSVHASETEFKGCVQCHGGGEGRHDHLIERITQPAGILIERYAHMLSTEDTPTAERVAEAIHPNPKQIMTRALPSCEECHESIDEDESLPKLFELLDKIAQAEESFAATANRLDRMSQGVLLVDRQRFLFEEAKTHLIALAPLQHTLDNELVADKVAELNVVGDQVNVELDRLEAGLVWRRRMLIVVWVFCVIFAYVLYLKYRHLKAIHVQAADQPSTRSDTEPSRRTFLDLLVGLGTTIVGAALAIPAVAYLWPAAKGGASSKVEVTGAANLNPGESMMVQANGRPVIVVRTRTGYRAFSAACTHLGCLVTWETKIQKFKCPCHAAIFDESGGVVSGPPPAPLPEYAVAEVGGAVYVTLS